MPESTVLIVGAGASGLSAAGALSRRGITAVLLEKDDAVGGTWARRYDRLHLHTVRSFSGLAHYPIPRRYPKYLSRDQYVEYLQDYARHFDLRIETSRAVTAVHAEPATSGWTVTTGDDQWHCRAVVIATGQYSIPTLPSWPGRDRFTGELIHSSQYTNGAVFRGKRVLVVGAGNSGAEIATDLAEQGAVYVALSIRTQPPIVPRDPFGLPVQRTGILLSLIPPAIADHLARLTARWVLGDLTSYGLRTPEWMPYSSQRVPVIDVGFVDALKLGRIDIRPALSHLTATGAVFVSGRAEPFDVVIAATGFQSGLKSLLGATDVLTESEQPAGKSGSITTRPGLYFMGYTHSLRGHLFEANLASRRLARNIEQHLTSVATA